MNLLTTKKAFIFDLFDTLTGYESDWSVIPPVSVMLGLNSKAWNDQLLLHSNDRLTGKLQDPFLIIKNMAHNIDNSIPDELISEVVIKRTNRYSDALFNIPIENIETIRKLRLLNKKIALLSNADVMECSGWDNSPLKPLFDVVVFSCQAGFAKPDPAAYAFCINKLGVIASECVFVGDGGSNELAAAHTLGITTVFVSDKVKVKQPEVLKTRIQQSDYHIEYIPELLYL